VFVAALVLLTRILFIGAFSVAGEHVFDLAGDAQRAAARPQPAQAQPAAQPATQAAPRRAPQMTLIDDDTEAPLPVTNRSGPTGRTHPRPALPGHSQPTMPSPMAAKSQR
jgi:hypothetical protein